jgi:hypothetical protein
MGFCCVMVTNNIIRLNLCYNYPTNATGFHFLLFPSRLSLLCQQSNLVERTPMWCISAGRQSLRLGLHLKGSANVK